MSTGDYTGTKTFNSLWQFLEEYVPVVHKSVLKRSHANIFAPRELANYHVDDESDNAWTFMFYANNSWDINQGGETKFITNLRHEYNTTGTEYPEISPRAFSPRDDKIPYAGATLAGMALLGCRPFGPGPPRSAWLSASAVILPSLAHCFWKPTRKPTWL